MKKDLQKEFDNLSKEEQTERLFIALSHMQSNNGQSIADAISKAMGMDDYTLNDDFFISKTSRENFAKLCYIAGKIGDLPEAVYQKNFEDAKKEVLELGFIPISPLDLQHSHGKTWEEFMREDLKAMLGCHSVYALSNWRQSPGATIEIELAKNVGLNIIHQNSKK